MFLFTKRKRIIEKAVKKTVQQVEDRNLKIYEHFFYGAYDQSPQYLVVWYLFETDAELEEAKESGFCKEIERLTIDNLILSGYPKEAFELTKMEIPTDKIKFNGGTKEDIEKILFSLTHKKAMISFTTKEDIDKKTNGDYRLYFQ